MRITPIVTREYTKAPSFKKDKKVYDKQGKLLYRTKTYFFRSDLDWEGLTDFLSKKYQNIGKVNVIDHACSYGKEPYSLAMLFMSKYGQDAKKFFPIKARDIDKDNINKASNEAILSSYIDLHHINKITQRRIDEFFNSEKSPNSYGDYLLTPKPNLRKNVELTNSNILHDKNLMHPNNTVLFCRNFWGYLKFEDRVKLAIMLKDNLGKNSVVVIGDFEKEFGVDKLLETYGFKEVSSLENVYEKI